MLNVHAVAAVLAGVSGPAMLADKSAWTAVYVVAGVATEAFGVMCGRRPRCKKKLTFGLRSGASHVSGLFARHHDRWP